MSLGGGSTSVTRLRETAFAMLKSCGVWNVGGMIHPFGGWSAGVNEMDDCMDSRDSWMTDHPRKKIHT